VVEVHLQADVLLREAETVEKDRVPLRRLDRGEPAPLAQRRPERLLARDLDGHHVAGMVEVGRHLHAELAAVGQGADEPPEQRLVVGQPVQGGVGEHHVPTAAVEGGDVAELEAEAVAGQRARPLEHRRRAVQAERLGRPQAAVERGGQLPVAAAEVDDPATGHGPDQVEQVVEGLGALRREARVPVGVPGVHLHTVGAPAQKLLQRAERSRL